MWTRDISRYAGVRVLVTYAVAVLVVRIELGYAGAQVRLSV